jgi:hypothetical protein
MPALPRLSDFLKDVTLECVEQDEPARAVGHSQHRRRLTHHDLHELGCTCCLRLRQCLRESGYTIAVLPKSCAGVLC